AYRHAEGYAALGDKCDMVAACDIDQGRLDTFNTRFKIAMGYLDYHEMLEKENLDIVSICTWPHLHEPMVLDCVAAGVRAIHCEKPMANTWGGCKRMTRAAADKGVKLTFNHQRRFGAVWRKAKELIDDGAIGKIVRV